MSFFTYDLSVDGEQCVDYITVDNEVNVQRRPTSGVATGGHGWTRRPTHRTSARVGREICIYSKSFLEEYI